MIDPSNERIAWIDVETNGLDAKRNSLLQVACIITDGWLTELGTGVEGKVFHSAEDVVGLRAQASDFVKQMHTSTGLWDAVTTEGVSLGDLEDLVLAEMDAHIPGGTEGVRLGGNSITLDRNFIEGFLPRVYARLNYQSYDMSSISGFLALVDGHFVPFEKRGTHDALDDIRQSICEARHVKAYLAEPRNVPADWGPNARAN